MQFGRGKKSSNKYKSDLRYLNRRWGHNERVIAGFNRVLQTETELEWERTRERHRSKLWSLTGKKLRENLRARTDTFRGILISDEKLTANFPAPEIKVINEQGVPLSEAENTILGLDPKFSVYEGISVYQTKVQTEVMIDKLRWSKRSERERGGEPLTEEDQWLEVQAKTVYDEANATVMFSKARVTDFPSCRRITVPEPEDEDSEVVFAAMKEEIVGVTKSVMAEICDEKGNILKQNISKVEMKALRNLKKRVNEGEILIVPTDKSGRLSVTTKESYVQAMQPHVTNDIVIDLEERADIERKLNGHTLQLARILMLGEDHNHWDRFRSALTNKYGHIPTLSGFLKDHKPFTPGQPRKMRPVAGASEANNSQLCHLLAVIMRGLSGTLDEKLMTVCRSTEEMIARIEEVNQKIGTKVPVIFSTDVEAMYPSLDIEAVALAAKNEFLKSNLTIPINEEELALYCAIVLGTEELEELGLTEVCHTRAKTGGRKPGITTQEVSGRTEKNKNESLFVKPKRKPTSDEVRRENTRIKVSSLGEQGICSRFFTVHAPRSTTPPSLLCQGKDYVVHI